MGREGSMAPDVIPFSRPVIAPEAQAAAQQSLASGWLTTGPECHAFETDFAAWVDLGLITKAPHVLQLGHEFSARQAARA